MSYNSQIDEPFLFGLERFEILARSAFRGFFYPKCELGFRGFSIQNANLQLRQRKQRVKLGNLAGQEQCFDIRIFGQDAQIAFCLRKYKQACDGIGGQTVHVRTYAALADADFACRIV
jgi:hypothetical protein